MAIEKAFKIEEYVLEPVKLSKGDIAYILKLLKEKGVNWTEFILGEEKLNYIEEIDSLTVSEVDYFRVAGFRQQEDIVIELGSENNSVLMHNYDDTFIKGLAVTIDEYLEDRQQTSKLWYTFVIIASGIVTVPVVFFPTYIKNYAWLVLVGIIVIVYSTIKLKKKLVKTQIILTTEQPFFARNKDTIKVTLLGAAIGAILGSVITLILTLLFLNH